VSNTTTLRSSFADGPPCLCAGPFRNIVMGESKLIEPYYYRSSNFQNGLRGIRPTLHLYRMPLRGLGLLHYRTETDGSLRARCQRKIPQRQRSIHVVACPRDVGETARFFPWLTVWDTPTPRLAATTRGWFCIAREPSDGPDFPTTTTIAVSLIHTSKAWVREAQVQLREALISSGLFHWEGPGFKPIGYGYESVRWHNPGDSPYESESADPHAEGGAETPQGNHAGSGYEWSSSPRRPTAISTIW